ncbi:MAG: type VI secretion system accessory protein TagJ [Caulobacteraceae bacterium]
MREPISAISELAHQDLKAGDIDKARAALVSHLRDAPGDAEARMFLFQLMCVEGQWDKAHTHLRALAQVSPEAQILSIAYGQAIEAERSRADAMAGRIDAPLLVDSDPWAQDLVAALRADGNGQLAEGAILRARAFDASPNASGEVDGRAFEFIFDGDARFGPCFEAMVAGRWGLIPFCVVREISSPGPVDLRDLVWLPAEIMLLDGRTLAALLPARYPGTEQEDEAALLLGRCTSWREQGERVYGQGQRVWTLSDGQDVGMLSFRNLRFAARP